MATVYVSVGSNVDRENNVRQCLAKLRQAFGSLEISTIYQCTAVGFQGDDFLNCVVQFDTVLDLYAVIAQLQEIETQQGRRRDAGRFSSRTLDLDILLYDDLILEEAGLKLPRPDILRYAFVLCPLAELAGERQHPVSNITFNELWQAFDNPAERASLRPVGLNLNG
ncbi:MAG: 2-amino-4-hydroxy-6-hydroxymethyldihydropteridine diphosphokinase [Candidatus Competibacteraceae bacterium]|jgi:2-amino-4-hydroxy-6-hydroxymethyldihydropteridine diphosphokinase|nr:2-amino-4-hydroxy-6-hydroxymethyldihydropteridine diphosphokinase [Candidatus Competibacteraceae bacterium]